MRHVSEPPPSVLEQRPDCPVRLDLAIQRAMAKDPADRFASMDELCAELEACLAELDGRDGEGATMIVPPAPRPRRARPQRERRRFPVGDCADRPPRGAARRRRRVPAALERFGEEGAPRRVRTVEAGPAAGDRSLRPRRRRLRARRRAPAARRTATRQRLDDRAVPAGWVHQGGRGPGSRAPRSRLRSAR